MIKVLLFASLRDAVGVDEVRVPYDATIKTVSDVIKSAQQMQPTLQALMKTNTQLMLAVNQEICRADAVVADGDEVALLPPVTGG